VAMLLSAVAGAAGALAPQFAGWLALPARLLLTYMLDIVHMLSNIPSVLIHRSINIAYMLGLYGLVLAIILVTYRKLPKKKELFTDETAASFQ
jgi:hypothetical protein